MGVIINPTIEAKDSFPFVVQRGQSCTVKCWGLAGVEEYILQWDRGDGVFEDAPLPIATLTVDEPALSIVSSGNYRLRKPTTVGSSGAAID